MRAEPVRPASAPRARAQRGPTGSGFAALVAFAPPAAAAAAALPPGFDGLLALQEGDGQDRHARRHGADMLARLRRLQLALLGSGPSPAELSTLAGLCDSVPACDGQTAQALAAIVLRARIEIAKFR